MLLFDQFEELFSYPPEQVLDFKRQLSDVLYRVVPDWLLAADSQRIKELDEADQELLYRKPEVKVVFSIRTDRLALLNELKDFHPAVLRHCYELDALDDNEATEAIRWPAGKQGDYETPEFEYDPGFVDQLLFGIRNTQDQKIETTNLQIVCSTFEKFILPEVQRQNRQPIILNYTDLSLINITNRNSQSTIGSIKKESDIQDIFRSYYIRTMDLLAPSERTVAEKFIEEELVKKGQRIPFALEYLLSRFEQEGLTKDLLDKLATASLLRVERDNQGRMIYELAHDTLVKPVTEAAEDRKERKRLEQEAEQKRLEQEAEQKRLEQQVLDEQTRAQKLQMLTLIAQESERKATTRSQIAIVLASMALLITGVAVYFWVKARETTQQVTAYYWAAESDDLLPDQALRLLAEAAVLDLSIPQVYKRLFSRFNNADSIRFARQNFVHQAVVNSAVFSPDGARLLTASFDSTAKLWYTAEGVLQWIKDHPDKIAPLTEENRTLYRVDD